MGWCLRSVNGREEREREQLSIIILGTKINRKIETSLTGPSFLRRKQNNSWDFENELTYPLQEWGKPLGVEDRQIHQHVLTGPAYLLLGFQLLSNTSFHLMPPLAMFTTSKFTSYFSLSPHNLVVVAHPSTLLSTL